MTTAVEYDDQYSIMLSKMPNITHLFRSVIEIKKNDTTNYSIPSVSYEANDSESLTITISGIPRIDVKKLNHCIIERILNHVKDASIWGRYEDSSLRELFNNRPFCFCLTYSFYYYKNSNKLNIMFHISRTSDAPTWIETLNNGEISLTPMSEKEIYLFAETLVRQCKHAISNWLTLAYNDAISKGTKPRYYAKKFPKT